MKIEWISNKWIKGVGQAVPGEEVEVTDRMGKHLVDLGLAKTKKPKAGNDPVEPQGVTPAINKGE